MTHKSACDLLIKTAQYTFVLKLFWNLAIPLGKGESLLLSVASCQQYRQSKIAPQFKKSGQSNAYNVFNHGVVFGMSWDFEIMNKNKYFSGFDTMAGQKEWWHILKQLNYAIVVFIQSKMQWVGDTVKMNLKWWHCGCRHSVLIALSQ